MPIDHRLRCFENPNLISSIQGCYNPQREPTPFTPSNRTTNHTFKPVPTKIAPVSQSLPFSPLPTSITPLPNNNSYHHINNLSNELQALQNKNLPQENQKEEDDTLQSKVLTKFTYFSEELRQEHLNYVKSFSQHPEFRNIDKTAAILSNAAYMENTGAINEYLNEITDLGEQGWKLSPESRASNEWVKTFVNEETGEVAVANRGTVSWLKDDGIANITNTTGGSKFRQMLSEDLDLDIRTRKARLMDDTYKFIKETYGENVKISTGHSQGGYDSAYAQSKYFQNAEVINFNPAPSGVVPKELGRSWTTPNDVVSLTGKMKALTNPNQYEVHTVKSTANTVLNRITGGHMIDNFVDEFAINGDITETSALLSHTNGSSNLPNTIKSTVATNVKNIGRGVVVAMAGVAGDLIIDNVAPDQPEELKTAEKSVLGAGLMKKAASMVGAPSILASETVIPLFTSYEAANLTGEAVDSVLDKTDLGTVEKSTISGTASGIAGSATFTGTSAAVVKTGQFAKATFQAARAGTIVEVAEETELVPLLTSAGEATEIAETAAATAEGVSAATSIAETAAIAAEAAEAALATAELAEAAIITTETISVGAAALAGGEIGSLMGPETLGLSILVGAGVGALGGLIGGMFAHSQEEEARKEQEILENERKRLWEEASRLEREAKIAAYQERVNVSSRKHNEAAWLGEHKYAGATSYKEAFDNYTLAKDEEAAASLEAENHPFVLQKAAA